MKMTFPEPAELPRAQQSRHSFTLIEMIGVLAVLAILLAVVLPALIRETDKLVADTESANLQAYSDALQQSIERYRYIPGETNWSATIAAQLGASVTMVSTNARHQARVFLIDPNLQIGANGDGLPYAQTNFSFGSQVTSSGAIVAPISPRVMIVSTLGASLPSNLASGASTDFSNLWNAADGTVPSGGVWANWPGNPSDVKVQRINLSPLFVNLVLMTYLTSAQNGQYAVDGGPLGAAPLGGGTNGYFIEGTVLNLYNNSPTNSLDSQQVLIRDSSFVFDNNVWRSEIYDPVGVGGLLGGIAGVVAQFLAAPPNLNAANNNGNAQQVLVVQDMMTYMSNYDAWAAGNFSDNNLKSQLQNNYQPTMMTDIQGLIGGQSGGTYYPTNYNCAQ
jgi:type II secretory pathway pseudopilin PulG